VVPQNIFLKIYWQGAMNNGKLLARHNRIVPFPKAYRRQWGGGRNLKFLVTVLAVLYFLVLAVSQGWRLLSLQRSLAEIEQEISLVRSQNEALQQEVEQLHSPAYLEKLARQELGMVRPDELLFFFRESGGAPPGGR